MPLPPPTSFGLPDRFSVWRPGQAAAILEAIDAPQRVVVHGAPTGYGKSLLYAAHALITGKRTVVLTSTKGLQDQLMKDFGPIGMVDIRGQGNYDCLAMMSGTCDHGPCKLNIRCDLKAAGCLYYDQLRQVGMSDLVVTNYAYWVAVTRYAQGLGEFDLLVCDEAHAAAGDLTQALAVTLKREEISRFLRATWPGSDDREEWATWAKAQMDYVSRAIQEAKAAAEKSGRVERAVVRLLAIEKALAEIVVLSKDPKWILAAGADMMKLEPIWPAPYAEKYLFCRIEKVLLVSATIRPKALAYLGLAQQDCLWKEYPSSFPVARRQTVYLPTIRVNHRTPPSELRWWVQRIDQIIDRRMAYKGIVHTVSYARMEHLITNSRHRGIMLTHTTASTRRVVERFAAMPAPAVLVSPSVTTGWDFPYDACRYQIIGKVPFPDLRDKMTEARTAEDPDYPAFVAMVEIVQAAGRGMRARDDWCEVFIVDDNWKWFFMRYKSFAPRWFLESCRRSDTVPGPPDFSC